MCIKARGQHRASSLITLHLTFSTSSLTEPGAYQSDGQPVSSKAPPVSASPVLGLQMHTTTPGLYMDAEDLSAGPRDLK